MRKIPEIYRALRRVAVAAWLCALCACVGMSEDGGCTYEVGSGGDTVEVRLADWHVTGPFTLAQDSLWWRDYMADPLRSTLEANPDTVVRLWHNGPYHPKYGSPDLCEVFGIGVGDTTRTLDTAKDVRLPLVPDTRVTRRMLENHNVFLIGGDFCCPCVKAFAREVAAGRPRAKPGEVTLTACSNPYNAGGMILLYTSGSGPHFRHVINFPWMHGFRKEMMEVDL